MEGLAQDRECKSCGATKPLDEFYPYRKGEPLRRLRCRACENKKTVALRDTEKRNSRRRAAYAEALNSPEEAAKFREKRNAERREYRRRPEVAAKLKGMRKATPENLARQRRYEKTTYLRRRYGLSLEQFESMLNAVNYKCEICGRDVHTDQGRHDAATACIDHDHETGKIRGITCNPCNAGMGGLGDDPERLEKAAAYLRKTRQ